MADSNGSDSAQKQSYPGKGKMGPDGNKEKSSKGEKFAKGGSTHMFSNTSSGPQEAGQSASMGRSGNKFKVDTGSNKDVGPQYANPQDPGVSGHCTAKGNKWGVEGGKGKDNHMFGHTGSTPAKPA